MEWMRNRMRGEKGEHTKKDEGTRGEGKRSGKGTTQGNMRKKPSNDIIHTKIETLKEGERHELYARHNKLYKKKKKKKSA